MESLKDAVYGQPYDLPYLVKQDDSNQYLEWRIYPDKGIIKVFKSHGSVLGFFRFTLEWANLRLLKAYKYVDPNTQKQTWKYQYQLDEVLGPVIYPPSTLLEIIEELRRKSQSTQHNIKIMPLLNMYFESEIQRHESLVVEVVDKFGFEDKWYMPDQYEIQLHPGIMTSCKEGMKQCFENIIDHHYTTVDGIDAFQRQYEVTSIENKDILFAWGMMQPFYFTLFNETELIPYILLWGPGDAGISSMGKSITSKWWGHTGIDNSGRPIDLILSTTTNANLKEYIATIALGMVFDDLSRNWAKDLLSFFKGYLTNFSQWQVKNKESRADVKYSFKVAPLFTTNDPPELFQDPQLLSRGIVFKILSKPNALMAKAYKETMGSIPRGLIGWTIYQLTKTWTKAQLVSKYRDTPGFFQDKKDQDTARADTIIRLLMLGKSICKELFSIELQFTDVELAKQIQTTKSSINISVTEALTQQIQFGEINLPDNQEEMKNHCRKFRCTIDWIKEPIHLHTKEEKDKKKIEGWIYTNQNLADLCHHLGQEKPSLRQFYQTIRSSFADIVFIDNSIRKKHILLDKDICYKGAIFFPFEAIETEEDSKKRGKLF
jgi:hypothetical protein